MSTRSEIDRLGDRLRLEKLSDADLRELDQYRREFAQAYDHVISVLRTSEAIEPSGRPAKSTPAIVESSGDRAFGLLKCRTLLAAASL